MNEFELLVEDYKTICGYTHGEAINAALNTFDYDQH